MTIPNDTVTYASLSGDSVTFVNSYGSSVNDLEHQGILQGEQALAQYMGGGPTTFAVQFQTGPLGAGAAAENTFNTVSVTYAQLVAALQAHDTTAAGQLAVAGLPAADPSNGAGFALPVAYAQHLGLAPAALDDALTVTLNSGLPWDSGSVAAAVEHEVSEGGLGRVGSLGIDDGGQWSAMDLFRFLPNGTRDYTGGADNALTYFGLDPAHLGTIAFNNQVDSNAYNNGQDLADWASSRGDPFGPLGAAGGNVLSQTDIQVLQALGWTSPDVGALKPAADDYGNTLATAATVDNLPGTTVNGSIQYYGDRDWFSIILNGGQTYVFSAAQSGTGQGSLSAPELWLHDASGAVISLSDPGGGAAQIQFVAPKNGTFYLEVGAHADQGSGFYTLQIPAGVALPYNISTAEQNILRGGAASDLTASLALGLNSGTITQAQAVDQIVHAAEATSSVATTAYEYFTGAAPNMFGMDYLVSPAGSNPDNLNSAYYQSFGLENRYINFAVNLGSGAGAGAARFAQQHAGESLSATLVSAYTSLFGGAPSATKVDHLLNDLVPDGQGGSYARSAYFASYGGDGANGVGTKAAMVGWLMAEAVKSDIGTYALSNDALLHAAATNPGLAFGVDMVGHYSTPAMAYTGG